MEIKLIHHLARIMKRADLTELEIDDAKEGLRVHLVRGGRESGAAPFVNLMSAPAAVQALGQAAGQAAAPGAPAGGSAAGLGGSPTAAAPAGGPRGSGELPPGVIAIKSPMVGTFYRAASPDADPFVDVGTRVKEESVLCIIEAMKVMNEIKAELNGVIVEVLVENAEPVEYGQPLFLVQKG